MRRSRVQRTAWWALVIVVVVGFVLSLALDRQYTSDDLVVIPFMGYALVGAVVAGRRPENSIGWIFLAVGLLTSLAGVCGAGAQAAFDAGPPFAWWGVLSAWYNSWFWYPLLMLSTTFTFLLFPSGLPSRRWRWILRLAVVGTGLTTMLSALAPTIELAVSPTTGESVMIANPLSPPLLAGADGEESAWVIGPLVLGLICGLAAIVSVVMRTWRSEGVERQQMRLFAFSIILVPLQILASELLPGFGTSLLGGITFALALAFIAVACGLAILRYHLYEIDRIIGRTTAYGLVSGVLLVVYVGVVTTVTQFLPASSDLAVAAATLAALAVFRPVLGWAQHILNRRFNREQYDADRSVELFASGLRNQVDTNAVSSDLLAVLAGTVQPAVAGLWLRDPS